MEMKFRNGITGNSNILMLFKEFIRVADDKFELTYEGKQFNDVLNKFFELVDNEVMKDVEETFNINNLSGVVVEGFQIDKGRYSVLIVNVAFIRDVPAYKGTLESKRFKCQYIIKL